MATYHLTIVTPGGDPFAGDVEALTAPGEEGSFGVLAGHAPMIVGLRKGVLTVTQNQSKSYFVTGEGVLEVKLDRSVVILADDAEQASSLEDAQRVVREGHA